MGSVSNDSIISGRILIVGWKVKQLKHLLQHLLQHEQKKHLA